VTVSVIIASFNMREDVERCLGSLRERRHELPIEVIVVENGSTDGSAELIRERFPEVVLIPLERNLEWTRATNIGLRRATGDRLLLLNADTVVEPEALKYLTRFLDSHPEAGVVAGTMLNGDGTVQETAREFPGPLNALFGRHSWLSRVWPNNRISRRYLRRDAAGRQEPYEVGWVSAAAAMCPRAVLDQVGLLDESFTHWVDADWCLRVRHAGWRVYCVPRATIHHFEGYGRGRKRPRAIVSFHRGAYRLYRKHYVSSAVHPMAILAACGLALRCCWLLLTNSLKTAR
jgi:GT2 family glycosyltransferase